MRVFYLYGYIRKRPNDQMLHVALSNSVHAGRLTSQPELGDFHKAPRSYFGTRADLYAWTQTLEENSHLF